MLFTTATEKGRFSSWWDMIGALRRYGPMSPYRTKNAVSDMVAKLSQLYDPLWVAEHGASRSIEDFAERMELGQELTTRKGGEWAKNVVKLGEKWVDEIMEGSTRVNVRS